MSKLSYSEQLRHPNWQRRRLEILQRAGFKCERCEESDKTLHVHHRLYRKGAMAWDYGDADLVALCEPCHESETLTRNELAEVLAGLEDYGLQRVLGYAKAVLCTRGDDTPIPVEIDLRSIEEVEGLGEGLGLLNMEAHRLLTRNEINTAELQEIADLARRKARRTQKVMGIAATLEDLRDIAGPKEDTVF